MTIKQQGGIFGRNPTLNNVTVDGILTVDQIVEKTGAAGITLDGVTLKDGNVVLTNGKGIDFSATSGTGTSELFDDYEEGTWTPTLEGLSGGSLVFSTIGHARYTKIGRVVTCSAYLSGGDFSTHTASGSLVIKGLPFSATSVATGVLTATYSNLFTSDETDVTISGYTESTLIRLLKGSSLAAYTDTDLNSVGSSGAIVLSIVYDTGA